MDLVDLWAGRVTIRRTWTLVRHRLLVEMRDDIQIRAGTALSRSIAGERGDWSRLDLMVADALGVDLPESKTVHAWKAAQNRRLMEIRKSRGL